MVRFLAGILASSLIPALSGCGEGKGMPGDDLGTYAVDAALASSTCGQGALQATDPWSFEVRLSRFEDELFWENGRESVQGDIADDDVSFEFEARVEVEISPAGKGEKGCTVSRADRAEGRLSSGGADVESFSAALTFEFAVLEGSDCSDWIGVAGGFEALPCSVSYDPLKGRRIEEPEAEQ